MAFIPYLNFGGNCREALTRYHEIFGGELELLPFDDVPGDLPPSIAPELIANGALVHDGSTLYGSDEIRDDFAPPHGMLVNFTTGDLDEGRRVWTALSEGGEVQMDFGETFWSPGFGICVDRFGTPWMVNVEPAGDG